MKHVFVFFTIILALIPEVYADDDNWIDGITFRYGEGGPTLDIDFKSEGQLYDNIGTVSSGGPKIPKHLAEGSKLFPLAIELKENLMNSWSYRQGFIDWTINNEINNLSPNSSNQSEIVDVSTTKKYYRQSEGLRTVLQNNFFNSKDKEFTSANPNWALSADSKFSALMIGYSLGIFYPSYNGYHIDGLKSVWGFVFSLLK